MNRAGNVSRRGFLVASVAVVGGVAAEVQGRKAAEDIRSRPTTGNTVDRPPGLEIAEALGPTPGPLWRLAKQCGVDYAVGAWRASGGSEGDGAEAPWSYPALERLKQSYEEAGFKLAVIECRPPMNKVKLGLPGREDEIAAECELIRNMGALGIPVWCYEWMPVFNWLRTSTTLRTRGGALTSGYDHAAMKDAPLTQYGVVTEQQLWTNLKYFLERVVPVAEKAGVKLAMHPDDPPLSPIRGLGRIMRSVENYQRLLDLVPSPVNGIALCQGNFTLMTHDLPGVIRHFGKQGKIFFVHFRDVRGTPEKFEETFHDDGQTDMAACMRAYRDVGYRGVCRADHVPTLEGENNQNPGYSTIGRLYAIGYLKGLRDAVYSE
jgi:mannonate dehydratase